jgi:hypothetical protein
MKKSEVVGMWCRQQDTNFTVTDSKCQNIGESVWTEEVVNAKNCVKLQNKVLEKYPFF